MPAWTSANLAHRLGASAASSPAPSATSARKRRQACSAPPQAVRRLSRRGAPGHLDAQLEPADEGGAAEDPGQQVGGDRRWQGREGLPPPRTCDEVPADAGLVQAEEVLREERPQEVLPQLGAQARHAGEAEQVLGVARHRLPEGRHGPARSRAEALAQPLPQLVDAALEALARRLERGAEQRRDVASGVQQATGSQDGLQRAQRRRSGAARPVELPEAHDEASIERPLLLRRELGHGRQVRVQEPLAICPAEGRARRAMGFDGSRDLQRALHEEVPVNAGGVQHPDGRALDPF